MIFFYVLQSTRSIGPQGGVCSYEPDYQGDSDDDFYQCINGITSWNDNQDIPPMNFELLATTIDIKMGNSKISNL